MASTDDDAELRKLRWRCRRGMRELDQLLERWLDREWRQSPTVQRDVFLRLREGHRIAPGDGQDIVARQFEILCRCGLRVVGHGGGT